MNTIMIKKQWQYGLILGKKLSCLNKVWFICNRTLSMCFCYLLFSLYYPIIFPWLNSLPASRSSSNLTLQKSLSLILFLMSNLFMPWIPVGPYLFSLWYFFYLGLTSGSLVYIFLITLTTCPESLSDPTSVLQGI